MLDKNHDKSNLQKKFICTYGYREIRRVQGGAETAGGRQLEQKLKAPKYKNRERELVMVWDFETLKPTSVAYSFKQHHQLGTNI